MPFFTRILNFPRAVLARLRDQRQQARFRVGADFPLTATVDISGNGNLPPDAAGSRGPDGDWEGRVSDVSAQGLSVRLLKSAANPRLKATLVRITVDGRELAIPCTVAHFRVLSTHARYGLRLEFDDFTVQKAWHQIVEAVSLGASFALVGENRRPRVSLGLARRQWRSLNQARLTEWRETGSRKLDRFELIMEGHSVAGRVDEPGVVIRTVSGGKVAPVVETEMRRLVHWVTANMPAIVPFDLRVVMRRAAIPIPPPPASHSPMTIMPFPPPD